MDYSLDNIKKFSKEIDKFGFDLKLLTEKYNSKTLESSLNEARNVRKLRKSQKIRFFSKTQKV